MSPITGLSLEGQHRTMLSFEKATKVFDNTVKALEGVSFAVPQGQFCVILGPSGAGKSTLLKAVNGLTRLTSGVIELDGVPITPKTLRAAQRRVSMVHQQFNLVDRLDVAQNVLSGAVAEVPFWRVLLRWYPPHLRRRACTLVARVGLDEAHLKRRMAQLSGGQQQRVGIARAFLLAPDVILADEPVASLDPATSRDILALLHDAAREQGTTVLCSLHQVDLAKEFADRIIGMRHGRVVFDGPPAALDRATLAAIYGSAEHPRAYAVA